VVCGAGDCDRGVFRSAFAVGFGFGFAILIGIGGVGVRSLASPADKVVAHLAERGRLGGAGRCVVEHAAAKDGFEQGRDGGYAGGDDDGVAFDAGPEEDAERTIYKLHR
jgi:hypothetical protein